MMSASAAMASTYDYSEVARSVLIAILASYAAIDLAGRVAVAVGWARVAWVTGGAAAMGLGIWSMHFKGMLAFRLPIPVHYHWPTVLLSLLVAILASAFALYVVSRQTLGLRRASIGSAIMGGGIAGMHYIGMSAMRLAAEMEFHVFLVTLSIGLAILFSFAALMLAFRIRDETRWLPSRRIASAVLMGTAVSAMHYTGMASASFTPSARLPNLSQAVSISALANNGIAIVTVVVLAASLVTSSLDRNMQGRLRQLNEQLEHRVAERTSELTGINEELNGLRNELRLVVDTIPALVWSTSSDGSTTFLNQRFRDYTGMSIEQGLGTGWFNPIHPDDRPGGIDEWWAAFARGEAFEMEGRLRRSDGEYRSFFFRGVPLRDELGNIVKWYGTASDNEDRKRAREALREAQAKVASVTRRLAMGELAAAIAHEINQPLTAIVTNANFCLRQLRDISPNLEMLREAIAEIVDDGARASTVISRIRSLVQTGAHERVGVELNQIIQDVEVLLRDELTRNRVSLRTHLASNLPPVSGDHVLLQQVLINLVLNAIDSMRALTDRRRELLITSATDHDHLLVEVMDSGIGFNPQQAERIFEPFFTTKADGVGMGLSISRSIVESHGGRLWAELGSKGSIFRFTLPIE